MAIKFDFWIPSNVNDRCYSNQYRTKSYKGMLQNSLIKVGRWVDQYCYFGSTTQELKLSPKPFTNPQNFYFVKGRAKIFELHNEIKYSSNFSGVNALKHTVLKIAVIVILFPVFIGIKACYKYFYVKAFFELKTDRFNLDDLINTYPNDPDLLSLRLSNQYIHLKFSTKEKTSSYYPQLRSLINQLKEIITLHPNHIHARALFREIFSLNFPISSIDLIKDDKDWFAFFDLGLKESKLQKFPNNILPSFLNLFNQIKTDEDKTNFRMIYELKSHIIFKDHSPIQNFLINTPTLIKLLGEDRLQDMLGWLLEKENRRTFSKVTNQTALMLFYQSFLNYVQKPYSKNIIDLEQRFLKHDDGFTEEYRDRNLLANIFGIFGTTNLQNIQMPFTFFPLQTGPLNKNQDSRFKIALNQVIYSELEFVLNNLGQNSINKDRITQLQKFVESNESPDFSNLLCSPANNNGKYRIPWSQVFYKGLLLIGSQRFGSEILALKVNPDKFNSSNYSKFNLDVYHSSLWGRRKSFLKQDYFEGLSPKILGTIRLKNKKIKNYPWTTIKLNILSLIFIILASEELEKGESFEKLQKKYQNECLSITNEIVGKLRVRFLEKYLEKHSGISNKQEIDRTLLNNITFKAAEKNWPGVLTVIRKQIK
ncbi:MAG: hypothetical protein H0W88_07470 [Parachlamydiaceae bacterium]|nr:hypothetical protein [Parachlamydiaceae bacterium]